MSAETPNILVVMADFMGALALPPYGNPVADMPNISALAEQGVVFEQAYCNAPVCTPSRASMMTGLMPSSIDVFDNGCDFSAGIPTLAHHLRLAGYRTRLSGKMHFVGPDQLHGFESRLTTDQVPSDFGWTPPPGGERWSEPRHSRYPNLDAVVEAGPVKRSMGIDFDDEVAFTSTRCIYDMARDDDPRPFLLVTSFIQPHHPFVTTQAYWDRYADVDIPLPDVPAMSTGEMDALSRKLFEYGGMGEQEISEAHTRRARRAYYGMLSDIDDKIGELRKALRETGLERNTLIVITSDHGNMLGERGLWGIRFPFEAGTRVPLIFHQPGQFVPARQRKIVSLVDLAPTLIEIAGGAGALETAGRLDGQSLLPALQGGVSDEDSRSLYVEYCGEGLPAPWFMVRHGQFKLIHCEGADSMLFDLQNDPLELRNLADDPAHGAVLDKLLVKLETQWDAARILERRDQSRWRRNLVHRAQGKGEAPVWDYAVDNDPLRSYQRNFREPWQSTEARGLLK